MKYNHLNDVRILPFLVTLTGGKVERHNASSRRRAEEKALAGKSRYCKVISTECLLVEFGS